MIITDISATECCVLTISNGSYHRKGYDNSTVGRAEFIAECADVENYQAVIAAWGDTPTVVLEPELAQPPSLPEINAANIEYVAMMTDVELPTTENAE